MKSLMKVAEKVINYKGFIIYGKSGHYAIENQLGQLQGFGKTLKDCYRYIDEMIALGKPEGYSDLRFTYTHK